MLLPNTTTPSVTIHAAVYMDTVLGSPTEIYKAIQHMDLINLTNQLYMFKELLRDEGYELSDEASLRLFQILVEVTSIRINDLSDVGFPLLSSNDTVVSSLIYEMSSSVHQRYLRDFSCASEDIFELLEIYDEMNLKELVSKTSGAYVPLWWVITGGSVSLHLALLK